MTAGRRPLRESTSLREDLEITVRTELDSRPAAGRPASEILAWSRAAMRRIAGYHFGWWDTCGRPTNGSAGKAVRPALALLCAQAVGADPEAAVPAAVAVELVHNFSLLHDDVMDHDPVRRHRATAWAVFGVADAILAGDALLALAAECLAQAGPAVSVGGVQLLSRCVAELCHGQSLDISFERRDRIELDECLAMSAAKTGSLLGCACALGALAGGATAGQVTVLAEFGRRLGLALQLVDDLLGIWGDQRVTGKPVHSDLLSRKKSLVVTAALNSETGPGQELAELYQRPEPFEPGELPHIAGLIERAGAREWSGQRAAREITAAAESLAAADCEPEAAAALREVARLLLTRDH
jgi:geranylgeranyl diphosphate synthase type I